MSQHDFNIANQTFPSFRADLNDALQASATMSAGSSAPTTPYPYQLWFDTTTDTWKVRNSGNTAWISTITTDLATGNVGIGAPPNATFGSLLYTQGTPAANKPIVSAYSQGNSNNAGFALFNDSGNRGIWTTGSTMRFTRTYEGNSTADVTIDASGNVGIGGAETTVFNGFGGDMKFVVIGDDSTTTIANNSDAGIAIVNTNQTAGNLAGLHFARADTDDSPNYAGASIVAQFPEAQVTGQYPKAHLAFLTSSATNSAPSEKMRIDASGNVGIGTSSPSYKVSLEDSSNFAIHLLKTGSNDGWVRNIGTMDIAAASGGGGGQVITFSTGANYAGLTERMRVDGVGNLLVGTTNATGDGQGLELRGDLENGGLVQIKKSSSSVSGNRFMMFARDGSVIGSISMSGTTAVAYNTSSDYRLKTAVNYDWDATTRLKQLRPARFEWIADGDDAVPVDGFLAHEVQDVVPEAITGTKDAMRDEEYQVSAATGDIYTPAIDAVLDEDGNEVTPAVAEVIHSTDVERPEELAEGQQWRETTPAVMGTRSVPDYQGIDQSKLVPLLVKTIQELEARITALEAS